MIIALSKHAIVTAFAYLADLGNANVCCIPATGNRMFDIFIISQGALTQLIQYYHRFHKVLSQRPFANLPIRSELINIHNVMVEVKKHKPNF